MLRSVPVVSPRTVCPIVRAKTVAITDVVELVGHAVLSSMSSVLTPLVVVRSSLPATIWRLNATTTRQLVDNRTTEMAMRMGTVMGTREAIVVTIIIKWFESAKAVQTMNFVGRIAHVIQKMKNYPIS
jgi:hypothetical protein